MAKRVIPVRLPARLQKDGIDVILTAYANFAQADVIDYRGGRPSKYDTEDALTVAREALRKRYPSKAQGIGGFRHHYSRGEVSSWRISFPTKAQLAAWRRTKRRR